ncbi:MAG: hypothetical protein Q8P59_05750 [Dehalococcoidia bacterium]|nr:hypothetical protein [Dehalococcoidia bacterium]
MRNHKSDSAKYRRHQKKQRENRTARKAERKEEERVQGKVESDTALAARLGIIMLGSGVAPPPVEIKTEPEPEKRPICPLCKREITLEEGRAKNCEPIEYNRRCVVVHKTCPGETPRTTPG